MSKYLILLLISGSLAASALTDSDANRFIDSFAKAKATVGLMASHAKLVINHRWDKPGRIPVTMAMEDTVILNMKSPEEANFQTQLTIDYMVAHEISHVINLNDINLLCENEVQAERQADVLAMHILLLEGYKVLDLIKFKLSYFTDEQNDDNHGSMKQMNMADIIALNIYARDAELVK